MLGRSGHDHLGHHDHGRLGGHDQDDRAAAVRAVAAGHLQQVRRPLLLLLLLLFVFSRVRLHGSTAASGVSGVWRGSCLGLLLLPRSWRTHMLSHTAPQTCPGIMLWCLHHPMDTMSELHSFFPGYIYMKVTVHTRPKALIKYGR